MEESLLDLQATRTEDGRHVLISTRMFTEVYNIPTLIKAVELLRRSHPTILFKLAGEGPLRKELEDLVERLGLREHVVFLGFLARQRMLEEMSQATCYVSASLSDSASVSLLEAMAIGLTPVVSDIPANHDWIVDGENGFLAHPTDARAFAEKLEAALALRPEHRRHIAGRNKEIVRTRALLSSNMAMMEAAYQRLLA